MAVVPVPIPLRRQRGQRNPKSSCPRCAQLPWGFVTRAPATASPRTPPPLPTTLCCKSRVSHSSPSLGWGSAWGHTLEEGWCRDGGSPVPSLVAQPLHRPGTLLFLVFQTAKNSIWLPGRAWGAWGAWLLGHRVDVVPCTTEVQAVRYCQASCPCPLSLALTTAQCLQGWTGSGPWREMALE